MLTKDLLNELFWYDEVIGELRWKVKHGRGRVDSVAGCIQREEYRSVGVNGKLYPVHRLIWTMVVGEIPDGYVIDHIDGNHSNNMITNLRLATPGENSRNRRNQSNNTSGAKGVSFDKQSGKWKVQIMKDGKVTSALFATKELAESFVRQARELLHEDFCNHGEQLTYLKNTKE